MSEKYFLLYENCRLVSGKNKSLIMDIQRNEYYEISNLLFEILNNNLNKISIKELKKMYGNEYDSGIEKYFDYLNNEELGFYTIEPDVFPKINLEYKSPYQLLTAIIAYNHTSNYSLNDVMLQLVDLGCQSIQIRIFKQLNLRSLQEILNLTTESRVQIVEVYLDYKNYNIDFLLKIMKENLRLKIILHNYFENKIIPLFDNSNTSYLVLTTKKLKENSKEVYSKKNFICNTLLYMESLNYNSGLNRKVSIDFDGEIKNYISHKKSFGNVHNDKLSDVIKLKNFKKLWKVTNNKIEICKECQFRHMCVSNSDVKYENGKYHKLYYCNLDI